MRAVVQRADGAAVEVDGRRIGGFDGPGLVVLVGVTHDDTEESARRLARKVHELRLFDADRLAASHGVVPGPRERSAAEVGLPLLVVSQFTLYGRTDKGRRPTWDGAAPGSVAEPLVDVVVDELRRRGAEVHTGVFGAHMRVSLVNDGPVTLVLDVP